jgi:aryl-alcohol dehydrogenase-like predicted oxidoreductase
MTEGASAKSRTKLGTTGPEVFPLGLGCMAMSGMYGPADEAESIRTIHQAIERGVTLIDTGDFYGMGHNELLIREALKGQARERAVISVKFGALRDPAGGWAGYDARPPAVKNFLTYSLRRLGTDYIDIYRPARLDPKVPIEETIGAIGDMVKAGYVRYIGLSEVGPETIRRAAKVHPICDLQIEYSLISRSVEDSIVPALSELGIGMTAYAVLSRGLLAGSKPSGKNDFRSHMPRFAQGNAERNQSIVDALARLAAEKGVSPAQLAIAWVRAKGHAQNVTVIPTLGSRTRQQLSDALSGIDVPLDPSDVAALEAAVPANQVAGTRYPEAAMATLDSEKR